MFNAAAQAAQEIGHAAKAAQESWSHVKKARSKAGPVTKAVQRATSGAARQVRRSVNRLRGK